MEHEVIETRTGKTCLGKDGIIRFINFPNVEVTLEDARGNVATVSKLGRGRQRLNIQVYTSTFD